MAIIHGEKACQYIRGESFQRIIAFPANKAQEHLKAKQADLEASVVKIISAPDPYPAPGRALRNVAGRCLITAYTRGETRTLFDTMQAFLKIVGDFKTADREPNKMWVRRRSYAGFDSSHAEQLFPALVISWVSSGLRYFHLKATRNEHELTLTWLVHVIHG